MYSEHGESSFILPSGQIRDEWILRRPQWITAFSPYFFDFWNVYCNWNASERFKRNGAAEYTRGPIEHPPDLLGVPRRK